MSNKVQNMPVGLTGFDIAYAMIYASERIRQDKCNDPQIKNYYKQKYNLKDDDAYTWIDTPDTRKYPCITDKCPSGTCSINTKEMCDAVGDANYPFDTTSEGNPLKVTPEGSYVQWQKTPWANNEDRCVLGNPFLKRWCISPGSRGDGEKSQSAIPPFNYNEDNGQCEMSPEYCAKMQMEFDTKKKECITEPGQDVGEFVLGKTIFRGWKNVEQGGTFCGGGNIVEKFTTALNETPSIKKVVDEKMIKDKVLLKQDFLPGVHLYMIDWKNECKTEVAPSIGFVSSELSSFNKYIQKENGVKYLVISQNDLQNNKDLKKLFVTLCLFDN
jgi:hypothetical protein